MKLKDAGLRATFWAGVVTYSARQPSFAERTPPYTSSPTASPSTPSPSATTTPAKSLPMRLGKRVPLMSFKSPRRIFASSGLIEAAWRRVEQLRRSPAGPQTRGALHARHGAVLGLFLWPLGGEHRGPRRGLGRCEAPRADHRPAPLLEGHMRPLRVAGRAHPSSLAREGNEKLVLATLAAHPREAVRQYSALQVPGEVSLNPSDPACRPRRRPCS
jgi:hypothetical protein